MPAESAAADVIEALQRLIPEMPRSAAEAADLRRRTRELDKALGAQLRPVRVEEEA